MSTILSRLCNCSRDNLQVQEIAFSSYDVTNLAILPLLFQTGYLTITDYDAENQLHIKQEKYYQSIFYLIFKLMSLSIQAEVQTNDGRIDAVAEVDDHIYIFEFKLDKTAQAAVDQIQNKDYALKYALHSKPITKVGVNFDSDKGQIGQWKIADENE